jgi:hypothetical protein
MGLISLKKALAVALVLLAVSLVFNISTLNRDRHEQAGEQLMLQGYADIKKQLDLRAGNGTDARLFITPDAPEVQALVKQITGGFAPEKFWKDYGEMYRWVTMNVEFTEDSPLPLLPADPSAGKGGMTWENDFWRLPAETIRDKVGDCEDMSTLLASMLLAYNEGRYQVWIIGAKSENPPKAHIALAMPLQGRHMSIFDTAGRYYTPFANLTGFGSLPYTQALDQWFTSLKRANITDAQVYVVFSNEFYREFSGNDEFLAWAADYYQTLEDSQPPPATSPAPASSGQR